MIVICESNWKIEVRNKFLFYRGTNVYASKTHVLGSFFCFSTYPSLSHFFPLSNSTLGCSFVCFLRWIVRSFNFLSLSNSIRNSIFVYLLCSFVILSSVFVVYSTNKIYMLNWIPAVAGSRELIIENTWNFHQKTAPRDSFIACFYLFSKRLNLWITERQRQ